MHRDCTRSLPPVHSLSGFAGLEEYNHETNINGSLADSHLFVGHGGPGHLSSGGAEYWREISSTFTGAAVRAALRAGVGCDLPVDHVVPLGSRLADQFPGGSWSHRGSAGVGIDSDEDTPRHCGATAFHRLPGPIWIHLAHHFRPHARTVTHLLAEMALSGRAVVCIPRRTGRAVHLSTTTCPGAPGWWGVQSPTTSPA